MKQRALFTLAVLFAVSFPRKPIIAAGVFVWSALTAASGLAQSFWQLCWAYRLGLA